MIKLLRPKNFLSFARKYKKQLLNTGPDPVNTASKKAVHIPGEFLGHRTADPVTKLDNDKIMETDENTRNIE